MIDIKAKVFKLFDNVNEYATSLSADIKSSPEYIQSLCITFNAFRDLVYQESKDKGFHSSNDPPNIGNYCSNLHGEVSELWEAWRKGKLDQPCDKADKMKEYNLEVLSCAQEELADIVIRAFDTAKSLNVDIAKAIYWKLMFNRTRERRNGGKLA